MVDKHKKKQNDEQDDDDEGADIERDIDVDDFELGNEDAEPNDRRRDPLRRP